MITIKKYKLFLLALFTATIVSSKTTDSDSLKHYSITDPRNPDCLCRTYQKLAEKEYKNLLKAQHESDQTVHSRPQKAQRKLFLRSSKKMKKPRRPKQRTSFLDACFKW